MRYRDHDPAELAFYSKATTDIEFLFPFAGASFGVLQIELIMILPAPEY